MCYILLKGLRNPDYIVRRKDIEVSCDRLMIKMGKLGLLINIKPGVWRVNIEMLQKVSYVVTDDLFDKLSSPEYLWIQKQKLKGKTRTHEDYVKYVAQMNRLTNKARACQLENRARIQAQKKDDRSSDPLSLENILFPPGK